MLQSYVEKHGKSYVVKTAKVMDFGFIDPKITDRFNTLEEANKKADLCNYIFKKGAEMAVARG